MAPPTPTAICDSESKRKFKLPEMAMTSLNAPPTSGSPKQEHFTVLGSRGDSWATLESGKYTPG